MLFLTEINLILLSDFIFGVPRLSGLLVQSVKIVGSRYENKPRYNSSEAKIFNCKLNRKLLAFYTENNFNRINVISRLY